MFNFQELTYVMNGTPISLLNSKNSQYLSLNTSKFSFKVNGVHPYLMNQNFQRENKISTKFTLVLSTMPNYKLNKERSIITFGTQVSFLTSNMMFIVATNNGDLRLESLKGDMNLSSMNLPFNSKFTIIDPLNQSNFSKPVLFNDSIVLRSTFGGYLNLSVNQDVNGEGGEYGVNSNGMIMSEESIWKVIKTNVPYIPDWVYKRKFLNGNMNSYLYNLNQSLLSSKFYKTGTQNSFSSYEKKIKGKDKMKLSSLSTQAQDKALVEDILLTMLGMEGTYIKRIITHSSFNDFKVEFQIEPYLENPTADPPLVRLVDLMLPLSFYYDSITHFLNISSNVETGLVAKAFCFGLRKLLREYVLFVNQLDSQTRSGENPINLQQLWWLVQPCLKLLENLYKLCKKCLMIKGGALINVIYSTYLHETDSQMKKMYKFLLDKSFIPYFEMLKQWVCYGFLDNEHEFQEFMIRTLQDYTKENLGDYYLDLFWEMKFKLEQIHVPEFLTRVSDKILFIGKSLNIIRECGKIIRCPFASEFESFNTNSNIKSEGKANINNKAEKEENEEINFKRDQSNKEMIFENERLIEFKKLIEKIYDWSNSTLKYILFKEKSLESLIKSFKKFYLLECGDFFTYLLDLTSEMLFVELKYINFEKLKMHIDNAMRITSANLDMNKDQFEFLLSDMVISTEKTYLDNYTKILQSNESNIYNITAQLNRVEKDKVQIVEDLKVYESLVLESKIKWPLNLIFSKKNIIKYKILFRHLLRLKLVERQLAETWIIQQNFKMIDKESELKSNYFLSDMMLNCIKNLIYYFFNEVIEPNYLQLINNLANSYSMEDVMNNHTQFLDNCLKNCLLEDEQLFGELNNVIHCCTIFSRLIVRFYTGAIEAQKEIHQHNLMKKINNLNKYDRKRWKLEEMGYAVEKVFKQGNVKLKDMVDKFKKNFEERLKSFMQNVKAMNEK